MPIVSPPPGLTLLGICPRVIEGRGMGTCDHFGISCLLTVQTRFTRGNPRNSASPEPGDPAYTLRLATGSGSGTPTAGTQIICL